ncbi:beta-lactamase/transpeptidase-like protein [Flagelloscypha sp. PMI_526]|nr:beta-lactamase/transpeptidase-like protein [Flagelloscypha sp. PMI_526]
MWLLSLQFALAVLPCFPAVEAAKYLTPDAATFVNNLLSGWHSPTGISIAVVEQADNGTWLVETAGYGNADVSGTRVDESTLFYVGSNSKLFDIMATGLLVTNDSLSPRISWNTTMKTIFPAFALSDSNATELATIEDLMSHRTGLPSHDFAYKSNTNQSVVFSDILPNLKPSAPFRSAFQYTNIMYTVLGYIPTQLLQVPLSQFVKTKIFDPLGMSDSTYSAQSALASGKLAKGIGKDGLTLDDPYGEKATARDLPTFNENSGDDGNAIAGPGGVISNAKDLAVWLQTLLLNGTHPGTSNQVIPAEVIQKLATPLIKGTEDFPRGNEQGDLYYGGAQFISQYRGENIVEHDGQVIGFNSVVSRLPNKKFGVAVLSNSHEYGAFLVQIIKWRLIDAALGMDPIDWESRFKTFIAQQFTSMPTPTIPRPVYPPTASMSSIQGTYHNPAYGAVEFCYLPPGYSVSVTNTSSCQNVMQDVPLDGINRQGINLVVKREDSPVSTHWIVSLWTGNVWNVTSANFFPVSNGSSEYWKLFGSATGTVTLSVNSSSLVDGFGITGGFWDAGEGVVDPQGSSVRERSEVWFDKVGEVPNSARRNQRSVSAWQAGMGLLIIGLLREMGTSSFVFFI